jgi:acyl-CoA reductase-like NAD-dependent aldehyde dehydrogenase
MDPSFRRGDSKEKPHESAPVRSINNYVDGKWVDPKVERFRSVNPATGEAFASAPVSDAAAVDAAVAAARRAFDRGDWRWRKGSERARALLAFADALAARARDISELIAREMGKPVRVNLAREVEGAVDKLRYFAGAARFLEGQVTAATAPEIWDMVLPEPVGVAALIIPWNDPVDLAVRKLGAALAAGCTAVVKSSEITPASTAALIETADASGAFPAGVINLVHGPGDPTGEALVDHPGVDKISFTGSTTTGIRIMGLAAKRLAKVSLECGGKFPALILPDADLERCLDAVTYGAFMYAGQSCTACTRLIVHESLHDRVVEGVVARTKALPIGDPLDPKVLVGPMASRKQYDKAAGYIRLALSEGGRAAIGGDPGDKRDLFLPPTVLVGLPPTAQVSREEVFGPVLVVHRCRDEEEALALANNTPYGLGGSIWSQDINRALRLARRLDVADVWVNTHYIRHVETPFGGRHLSGLGRELGMAGVEEYLSWKRLCIDTRSSFHLKEWFESAGGRV